MAFTEKSNQQRSVSLAGEFPLDFPKVDQGVAQRIPGLIPWLEALDRWHFEFKTVLKRKEDELRQALDSKIGALETFRKSAEPKLVELSVQLTGLKTSLDDIIKQLDNLDGVPQQITDISKQITLILMRLQRIETVNIEQGNAIVDLQQRMVIVERSGSYEHTQNSPASQWVINHNLGRKPNVSVHKSTGERVHALVTHTDYNRLTVDFNASVSGYAECS